MPFTTGFVVVAHRPSISRPEGYAFHHSRIYRTRAEAEAASQRMAGDWSLFAIQECSTAFEDQPEARAAESYVPAVAA